MKKFLPLIIVVIIISMAYLFRDIQEHRTPIIFGPGFAPCLSPGGQWSEEFKECLGIDAATCQNIGGIFNECASACRNDPKAEICTMQCVQVCEFK